jgi:hypothetical protein
MDEMLEEKIIRVYKTLLRPLLLAILFLLLIKIMGIIIAGNLSFEIIIEELKKVYILFDIVNALICAMASFIAFTDYYNNLDYNVRARKPLIIIFAFYGMIPVFALSLIVPYFGSIFGVKMFHSILLKWLR